MLRTVSHQVETVAGQVKALDQATVQTSLMHACCAKSESDNPFANSLVQAIASDSLSAHKIQQCKSV